MAKTDKDRVKEYLLCEGQITGAIAFTKLRIYRLSEYIRRLRDEGMTIQTVMKTDELTGKEYGVYTYSN